MLAIDIKPSGNLSSKINRLILENENVQQRVSQVVRGSAFAVVANAVNLVPVSTGALRRSIKPTFFNRGMAALIGSFLPYAARQEFDITLNHAPRPPRRRSRTTLAGRAGTIIKGTGQNNPNASWGFLRKGLAKEKPNFLFKLQQIANSIGDGWRSA